MTDTPTDIINRIGPSAEAFAHAVLAEKKGFCGIRFEGGIAIFCLDQVEGSEILRNAFDGLTKIHEQSAIQSGDMK